MDGFLFEKQDEAVLGVFLDTETNGLNPHIHHPLEIAFKIIDVQSGALKLAFETGLTISKEDWEKSDPASLELNGFSWERVSLGKLPTLVAEEILLRFYEAKVIRGQAVFICQNPSFDRAFFSKIIDPAHQEALNLPYHWLDLASMYWAKSIYFAQLGKQAYPWETGISKDLIARTYTLPPESKPHRAMQGVDHLIRCYEAVVGFPNQ